MLLEARRSKHSYHYDRHSVYPVELVIEWIRKGGHVKKKFDKDVWISLAGRRYRVFAYSGTTCVACGIEAQYFALERDTHATKYHMNLYAVSSRGGEVLMTRDHIQPRSKGGNDALSNQQTMCIYCNMRKGNEN